MELPGNDRRIAAIRTAGSRSGRITDQLCPAGRALVDFHPLLFGIPNFIRIVISIVMVGSCGSSFCSNRVNGGLFGLLQLVMIILFNALRRMCFAAVIALQSATSHAPADTWPPMLKLMILTLCSLATVLPSPSASSISQLVDEVETEVFSYEDKEIPSEVIGELVMNKLKDLDAVAYVRFASVYREFKDINTFMDELKKVLN